MGNGRVTTRPLGDRARFLREKSEIQSPNHRMVTRWFGPNAGVTTPAFGDRARFSREKSEIQSPNHRKNAEVSARGQRGGAGVFVTEGGPRTVA